MSNVATGRRSRHCPPTDREQLENYVLWPDLRATWYRATIRTADHDDVEAFLAKYGTLKPAREVRYRYALHLAAIGDLDGYHDIYQAYFQGLEIAKLDCIALQAELAKDREKRVLNRARELWLTGQSQAEECDPVFKRICGTTGCSPTRTTVPVSRLQ